MHFVHTVALRHSTSCAILSVRSSPDCAIDLDTNSYSVPWRLVGETVQVVVLAGRVIVRHAGALMADHPSSVASEGAVPVGQKPR
jgi:hypothetical protein